MSFSVIYLTFVLLVGIVIGFCKAIWKELNAINRRLDEHESNDERIKWEVEKNEQ